MSHVRRRTTPRSITLVSVARKLREIVAPAFYDRRMTYRFPLLAAALIALAVTPCAFADPGPVELRILAINDFHANLMRPTGGMRIADPNEKMKKIMGPARGAETTARVVQGLAGGGT